MTSEIISHGTDRHVSVSRASHEDRGEENGPVFFDMDNWRTDGGDHFKSYYSEAERRNIRDISNSYPDVHLLMIMRMCFRI